MVCCWGLSSCFTAHQVSILCLSINTIWPVVYLTVVTVFFSDMPSGFTIFTIAAISFLKVWKAWNWWEFRPSRLCAVILSWRWCIPQICINILQMPYLLFTPYHVATDKPPAQDGDKFRSIFSDNLQPIATRGKKARGTLLVDKHCGNGCSIKRAPLSVSYYNEISGGHIGRAVVRRRCSAGQYCPPPCARHREPWLSASNMAASVAGKHY